MTDLRAGDIVLTRSLSPAGMIIRYFERARGQAQAQVNHCGVMVDTVTIVEALATVQRRDVRAVYGPPCANPVAIYRPLNLTEAERVAIVAKAASYVGKRYGVLKIVTHLADWCLGGRYLFRRLAGLTDYPICSWVVAYAYQVAGKSFGVDPGGASPADIWDFVTTRSDLYEQVWPLSVWPG
jgi:hypothetical protein